MSARAIERIDPILSRVRLCRRCGEEWPVDGEFWYFDREGHVMGHCKACWSERNKWHHQRRKSA